MIARAQAIAQDDQGPQYTYAKRALLEYQDAAGLTTKSEEKIYQVELIAGFPFDRLVRIQGRELTSKELKKEQQREERFRKKFVSANSASMAARKEGWVTRQLLDRYQFVVVERVAMNGRSTLVLAFKPKDEDLPAKTFQDKLLNRMAGTVWIDEADADTAKLSVRLTESIALGWLGVLGSLNQCELSLERKRLPDGVWVNARQTLLIHYRKLASTMRFHSTEESSGFEKVAVKKNAEN